MSLNLEKNRARMTVSVRGWNDVVIDSGEGETEEGSVLEDFVTDMEYDPEADPDFSMDDIPGYDPDDPNYDPDNPAYDPDDPSIGLDYDLTYDFGENFNWDALAEDLDINLDLDGNIDVDQVENLSEKITNLAHNEDVIYNYMADHGDSSGIPARIRVTNPPDRLEYSAGDEIDFSGIIVCAYSSLTTRTPFIRQEWDGPRHNQIPFDQLTFPVTMAESEADSGILGFDPVDMSMALDQQNYYFPIPINKLVFPFTYKSYHDSLSASAHSLVFTGYEYTIAYRGYWTSMHLYQIMAFASTEVDAEDCDLACTIDGSVPRYMYRYNTIFGNKKIWYYTNAYHIRIGTASQTFDYILPSGQSSTISDFIKMLYGNSDGMVSVGSEKVSIPVQWPTEYR